MTRINPRKAALPGLLAVLLTGFSISGVGVSYAAPDYDGDGSTTADCAPLDPAVHPSAPDKPDLSFEDTNCDGVDGELSKAVFVTKSGDDAATGTKDNPLKTIGAAITNAKDADPDKDVYVAGGTYSEVATLQSGVGIYGGFKPVSGARGTDEPTIITAAQQGLLANNVQVVLQLLTLRSTADGDGNAYGLRAINGSSVLLQGVTTQPGDGAAGSNGGSTSGNPGSVGSNGSNGLDNEGTCTTGGGAGGGGAGGGGNDGGLGGGGGSYGVTGSTGGAGAGTGAGGGGGGGAHNASNSFRHYEAPPNYYDEYTMFGAAGSTGTDGANGAGTGTSGANGSAVLSPGGGSVTFAYQTGAAGSNGGTGPSAGAGGGGGGGGGGVNNTFYLGGPGGSAETNGGGGGGGGGGGFPGGGGGGGGPGGGSFGIFVHDATVVVDDATTPLGNVGAGKGGAGGHGGAGGAGGAGAAGAAGGAGGYCYHYQSVPGPGYTEWYVSVAQGGAGGTGGTGGTGSPGGPGGGGVGGPSASLFARGATAAFTMRSGVPTSQSGGGAGGRLGGTGAPAESGPSAATLVAGAISATPTDFDADGVTDASDACPNSSIAGVPDANGDGCPDRAAKLADGDGDSIPDNADACPGHAAGLSDANGDGCPDTGVLLILAVDADRDGVIAALDCDDRDAARKPGNIEIPGNSVDENCDHVAAPYPVIRASVTASSKVVDGRTQFIKVTIKGIPAGGRMVATCKNPKGKRNRKVCPFKKVDRTYPSGNASVKLVSRFKRRRFPGGAVIRIQVTAPLTIGRDVTFKTRNNKRPTRKSLCMVPGATKATRCP